MSFKDYKTVIEEGDTVILFLSNNVYAIDVHPEIKNKNDVMVENVFQTIFGALKVRNLIGVKYGSKVDLSRGWGHILQPTPELWTLTLPHRTQIIYTPDISMILFQLEMKPGSIIIEAGTGSGSLSHAFIRTVKPTGHLYTFDFHEHRSKIATDEFKAHGLESYVTVGHRDVCKDGFGESLNGKADAVFLDLPHPWLGVPHAVKALKQSGGRFCSFSPCIEQVQRTCLALTQHEFFELETMEVLQTELKVQRRPIQIRDLDFLKNKASEAPFEEMPRRSTWRRSSWETDARETQYVTGTAPFSMPGHTGYLTVATLPPAWARTNGESTDMAPSREQDTLEKKDDNMDTENESGS